MSAWNISDLVLLWTRKLYLHLKSPLLNVVFIYLASSNWFFPLSSCVCVWLPATAVWTECSFLFCFFLGGTPPESILSENPCTKMIQSNVVYWISSFTHTPTRTHTGVKMSHVCPGLSFLSAVFIRPLCLLRKMTFGKVNELGQFIREAEPEPDVKKSKGTIRSRSSLSPFSLLSLCLLPAAAPSVSLFSLPSLCHIWSHFSLQWKKKQQKKHLHCAWEYKPDLVAVSILCTAFWNI